MIKYNSGDKIGEASYVREQKTNTKRRYAVFICKCGKEFIATLHKVKTLHTVSCGCKHREMLIKRNTTHNMSRTVEYKSWKEAIARCNNKNLPAYPNYGGRGIVVSDEWINSFETFFNDMGERPSKKHSLERKDVNGGYNKENCIWLENRYQSWNTRKTIRIEYNGGTIPLLVLCNELGLKYSTVRNRLIKLKWGIVKSINTPIQEKRRKIKYA